MPTPFSRSAASPGKMAEQLARAVGAGEQAPHARRHPLDLVVRAGCDEATSAWRSSGRPCAGTSIQLVGMPASLAIATSTTVMVSGRPASTA